MVYNEPSAFDESSARPKSPEQTSMLSPKQLNSPGLIISDSAMMESQFPPSSELPSPCLKIFASNQ